MVFTMQPQKPCFLPAHWLISSPASHGVSRCVRLSDRLIGWSSLVFNSTLILSSLLTVFSPIHPRLVWLLMGRLESPIHRERGERWQPGWCALSPMSGSLDRYHLHCIFYKHNPTSLCFLINMTFMGENKGLLYTRCSSKCRSDKIK